MIGKNMIHSPKKRKKGEKGWIKGVKGNKGERGIYRRWGGQNVDIQIKYTSALRP